ncbi:hypothetical protein ACN47E_003663 [Coniothyrium glycines]
MEYTNAPSKDGAVKKRLHKADTIPLWTEPLDTPGYVPQHLKRSATVQYPILEVVQRLLYRLKSSGADLEKLLALIGLYQAVRPVYHHLKDFIIWAFTSQITIPEADPVAKEVLGWMGAKVFADSRSRDVMLVTGGMQDANDDFHRRMMIPRGGAGRERIDDEVLCLPPIGTKLFWLGFRPFIFSRRGGRSLVNNGVMMGNLVDDRGLLQNSLTVMTIGWSLKPLRQFTALCRDFKLKNMTGTTTVYFAGSGRGDPYGDGWQSVSKAVRKLDTIDMDETVKSDLIKDAEYYYSDQSRQFFADCGIPYRRGYMFYGPPGTGKSSFSAALAGHLGCDIYHINLATGMITDGKLHRLFLGLPRKCIVVMEDIDSAGIDRELPAGMGDLKDRIDSFPEEAMEHVFAAKNRKMSRSQRGNMVTLSGLLNAIDGNASQEGRLLIMTSNKPDVLDAALTRPGRIDKKVHFGNMGKVAGRSIFKRLIGRSALTHDATITMEQVEIFATQFAEKIPENVFSPAQVQNFLQDCRGDARKALDEIDAWVKKNRVDGPKVGAAVNGVFEP